jgi:predicted transcriptional regulator
VGVRRDNPVTTYLSDAEKAQLEQWAKDTEKSQAHLLREAILEYLDHDRAARIEGEVRELNEKLDDVLAQLDSDSTHTHMPQRSDSLETARKMIRVVQRQTDNPDGIVKDDDLVQVVENHAGVDDRTIQKYKRLFRKRGLLFEHPGETPIWTLESDTWVEWVNQYANLNGGRTAAEEVMQEYPAQVIGAGDGYQIELEAEP